MHELTVSELQQINGGIRIGLGMAIAAGISFIIGVIDGYIRPLACR